MGVNKKLIWQKLDKIDDLLSGPSGIHAINTRLDGIEDRLGSVEERLDRIEDTLKDKLDASTFRWVIGGCCAFFLLIIQHFHG